MKAVDVGVGDEAADEGEQEGGAHEVGEGIC